MVRLEILSEYKDQLVLSERDTVVGVASLEMYTQPVLMLAVERVELQGADGEVIE